MKNAFGLPKYHPKDIFTDDKVVESLRMMFKGWLSYMEIKNKEEVIEKTFESFKRYSVETGLIEEDLREFYKNNKIIDGIKECLQGRAEWICDLIQDYVDGHVFDLGCGPGEIAQHLVDRKGCKMQLADVVDVPFRKTFAPNLPFYQSKQGKKLPFKDNQFDSGLLITVLHHSDDPFSLLDEIQRLAKGNIAIIESVYGLERKHAPEGEAEKYPELYQGFHSLDKEQQRKYGTFLDWFLNKMILGNDINCPYNFTTPENWERIFDERVLGWEGLIKKQKKQKR